MYRVGFATTQDAYDTSLKKLYEALDKVNYLASINKVLRVLTLMLSGILLWSHITIDFQILLYRISNMMNYNKIFVFLYKLHV